MNIGSIWELIQIEIDDLGLEERYLVYAIRMTKHSERTIKMADVATNPFVALSLGVAWRTTTRFYVIFLAASLGFGFGSVSVDYILTCVLVEVL